MHVRRALLLFALVLGLTALAASVAPPPQNEPEPPAQPSPTAPENAGSGEPPTLSFRAPPESKKLPEREAAPGDHIIVKVSSNTPGQATIPRLGRTATVTEGVPARFNILAPEPGTYDVMFEPVDREPSRLGAIVTQR